MIVSAFAFVSVLNIHAQVSGLYRANIPFDFSVGKKQYLAGHYNVEIRGSGKKYFIFSDSRGRGGYIITTQPGSGKSEDMAALDFQRIGESYHLRSIKTFDLTSSLPIIASDDGLAQNRHENKVRVLLAKGK